MSCLSIPYSANSLLYVDFIHSLSRFGRYDGCFVVTSGLSRFACAIPCSKKIIAEQTRQILVDQ